MRMDWVGEEEAEKGQAVGQVEDLSETFLHGSDQDNSTDTVPEDITMWMTRLYARGSPGYPDGGG